MSKANGWWYKKITNLLRSIDGHAYIYCLLEHKSYPDSLIHLQLLKYMLGIWELDIKQRKSKKLDIIVPLVMYHGKANWNSSDNFAGLFNTSSNAFKSFIPDFRYILFDLPGYNDDQIRGTIISRIVMLTFKHIFEPDFEQKLPNILALLNELLTKETAFDLIDVKFGKTADTENLKQLIKNIDNLDQHKAVKEKIKTITSIPELQSFIDSRNVQ